MHHLNWNFREVSYRDRKPAPQAKSRCFAASGAGRPKIRPGGLIFHQFSSFLLQGVRYTARVTFPLGVAEHRKIDMPTGLE